MKQRIIDFIIKIADNFLWLRNNQHVFALYSQDIGKFQEDLKISGANCHSCGKELTYQNLGGWVKLEGSMRPFCDSINCMPITEKNDNELESK